MHKERWLFSSGCLVLRRRDAQLCALLLQQGFACKPQEGWLGWVGACLYCSLCSWVFNKLAKLTS